MKPPLDNHCQGKNLSCGLNQPAPKELNKKKKPQRAVPHTEN